MAPGHHALGPRALPSDVKNKSTNLVLAQRALQTGLKSPAGVGFLKPETEPTILNLGKNVHTLLSSKGK